EVGVDVPAATEIVIVGADRFGLAQLHQLRGRVGRGGREGYCTLLTKSKKSARSERLSLLVDCHDGFAIAEHDLDLRGPGDIMGLRQHGAAIAISGADEHALLRQAFEDARALIAKGVSATELAVALGQWTRRKGRRPVTGIECLEAG
ncbi:MAG: hypothetical protein KDB53_08305, partial [Planctomycetes bacterium]|nr:hypothetical protein [Planctomycetota bacterium]